MSRFETGLLTLASLLMAAIVVSYVTHDPESVGIAASRLPPAYDDVSIRLPNVTSIPNDDYESWRPPPLPTALRSADQENAELIGHIRSFWILPPPSQSLRRLNHPEKYDHSEFGQSFVVDKLLRGLERGFYVDVWAGNGETNSNTLFLEKDRHWDGLLIEPNPDHFRSLIGKRRHAYALNACVSPESKPSVLNLTYGDPAGHKVALVQCFPLYSILRALFVRHVDYLSMKSQLEVDILRTLPLGQPDKLTIETLTIETHINKNRKQTLATNEEIKDIMTAVGYRWIDAGDRINKKNVILQRKKIDR